MELRQVLELQLTEEELDMIGRIKRSLNFPKILWFLIRSFVAKSGENVKFLFKNIFDIAELKQKLEDAKTQVYAENVDVVMENRKLKCALWLARAETAKWKYLYYWYFQGDRPRANKYLAVMHKCSAKAKEYK